MKQLLPVFIILLATFCNSFAQSNNGDYIHGAVIFKINPEHKSIIKGTTIQHNELQEIFSKSGVNQIVQKFPNSKVPVQKQDKFGRTYSDLTTIYETNIAEDQDIFDLISSLKKLDIIEYAHPHYLPQLLFTPDDPLNVNQQWYIEKIGAYQAFDLHQGDTTFVIGITDTGTDIDHEDLVYNIAYNWDDPLDGIDNDSDGFTDNFRGWDLAENDNNPQADSLYHGTWVSGLCAPETDNGFGLTGAAYKCKYMPIKISDNNNQLTMSYEGIVYAADHGCKIINCSWGGTAYTEMGQDVINYATINCDALVVAATESAYSYDAG